MKYLLLLILLWLAVRFVTRLVRLTFIASRSDRSSGNRPSSFSSSSRRAQVEEAEYEVIDSQIKQKE